MKSPATSSIIPAFIQRGLKNSAFRSAELQVAAESFWSDLIGCHWHACVSWHDAHQALVCLQVQTVYFLTSQKQPVLHFEKDLQKT